MEIILKEDVKKLGMKDELLKVKDGYGRNFLIPKGLAVTATESNKKILSETLKQRAFKEEKLKKEAEDIIEKLKKSVIKVGAKVGGSGKIFGSITTLQLAEALKQKGYTIDRKQITLADENIKTTGTYNATVLLHRNITANVTFEVEAE